MRSQVPQDTTALITQDDPLAVVNQADSKASRKVAEALAALEKLQLADGARLAATIWTARASEISGAVCPRPTGGPPSGRTRALRRRRWRAAVHRSIDALDDASVAVNNTVRIDDPKVAELIQIRRMSWSIRDNYGFQCSALRANVNSGVQPDAQLRENLLGHRAIYSADWRALNEIFERPGLSSELAGTSVWRGGDRTGPSQCRCGRRWPERERTSPQSPAATGRLSATVPSARSSHRPASAGGSLPIRRRPARRGLAQHAVGEPWPGAGRRFWHSFGDQCSSTTDPSDEGPDRDDRPI